MKNLFGILAGLILITIGSGCSLLESENKEEPLIESNVEKKKEEAHAVAGEKSTESKEEKTVEADPEYSHILTKQGLRFLKNKQYEDAQKLFTKAISLDPKNSEAAESLKAVETFLEKKKRSKDSQYSDLLTNRGVNLMEEEKYKEAIGIFERAIQSDPENTIAIRKRKEAIELSQKQKNGSEQQEEGLFFGSTSSVTKAPTIEKTDTREAALQEAKSLLEDIEEEEMKKPDETEDCSQERKKGEIKKDFYDGITLNAALPIEFLKGEYIQISGTAEEDTENITVFMNRSGEEEKQFAFTGKIQNGRFSADIFFPEEGEYLFSIMPKTEGTAKAQNISVISISCSAATNITNPPPTDLKVSIENGDPVFSWNDEKNNFFHVQFRQKEKNEDFYVRDLKEFSPPLYVFKDFTEGSVIVSIRGSKVDSNAFERQTEWSEPSQMTITAVQHISRKGNSIKSVDLNGSYTLGETIKISGTTELPLDETLLIIDPNMDVQEAGLTIEGDDFSGSFTPQVSGNHIFEVNQNDMLSLFVGASVHSGTIPMIPDYFDLEERKKETLSLEDMSEAVLKMINAEREGEDIASLTRDESLASLAQFRAQDMCDRNYMAHVDPDGKNAGDHAKNYGIERSIGENIGTGESVRSIHEGLMLSASHMRLIMDQKNKEAGFGFCWDDEDRLLGVEIFGQ